MKLEAYTDIAVKGDFEFFDFISCGQHGEILKRVSFTKTGEAYIYNLAMGDVQGDDEMNDWVITDNGDSNKILATIASIVFMYTKRYPERWVIFEGSTKERNRLYRMAIGLHYDELSNLYEIWGYEGNEWRPFEKNVNFSGFLIKRKKSKFGYEKGDKI